MLLTARGSHRALDTCKFKLYLRLDEDFVFLPFDWQSSCQKRLGYVYHRRFEYLLTVDPSLLIRFQWQVN